jgi:heme oxygenase
VPHRCVAGPSRYLAGPTDERGQRTVASVKIADFGMLEDEGAAAAVAAAAAVSTTAAPLN